MRPACVRTRGGDERSRASSSRHRADAELFGRLLDADRLKRQTALGLQAGDVEARPGQGLTVASGSTPDQPASRRVSRRANRRRQPTGENSSSLRRRTARCDTFRCRARGKGAAEHGRNDSRATLARHFERDASAGVRCRAQLQATARAASRSRIRVRPKCPSPGPPTSAGWNLTPSSSISSVTRSSSTDSRLPRARGAHGGPSLRAPRSGSG